MGRERDRGREPRQGPEARLHEGRAQDGQRAGPLRFGPDREPEPDTPKQRRPDWKKASARKVREATAPVEPERREDTPPAPEPEARPVEADDARPRETPGEWDGGPAADGARPHPEPGREPAAGRARARDGPAARLRFEEEDAPGPEPGKDAPKGPRPAGRGPAHSSQADAPASPAGPMGQSVPKDGGGKFRQESGSEKVNRAKFRMEKRAARLDKAKEKLAKQKPPRKKGLVRKAAGAAGRAAHGFVHGKIYQNEHENVGIEGAHRSELAAEAVGRKLYRYGKRKVRQHPARAVQRAQSRFTKATADYHFRVAAQEHPGLQKNAWSRFVYKQRLKRQYRKRAKEAARQGARAAQKTAVTTQRLAARTVGFVKRHPAGVLLVLACLLVVFLFQSCTSALAPLGSGAGGGIGATTYAARDEDILAAETAYCGKEAELQSYLDSYTATHSYDEYHFDLDKIGHDPYVLISILSAFHEGEWTLSDVEGTLQSLFDRQYILTERVVVETRYDSEGDPYSWYICYVTLKSENLSHLPVYIMGEEQLARYALYMAALGNRPDLFPGSDYVGKYTQPADRYEVPPEYLSDEQFAALLNEAEKYVGYPYVWGVISPFRLPSELFSCKSSSSRTLSRSPISPIARFRVSFGKSTFFIVSPTSL